MSRVLVVYADPAVGARLTAAMTEAGLDARAATSGERAMDSFIQEPTDVVVIDYELEGRDGATTAEAIRWMPGGRRARVILTAAKEPADGTLASLGSTVDAFATIVGPPDHRRLCAMVQRAAAVQPATAETRVYSTEQTLLEAERRRASTRAGPREVEPEEPDEVETPLTFPLEPSAVSVGELDDSTLDEPVKVDWEWRDTDGQLEGREVRAIAEAAAESESGLSGELEQTPFARVLHQLAEARATGALICVHPPDDRATTEGTEPTKILYFRSGVPVQVRSNLVAECLGQVLTRQHKIGPAALRESLRAVRRGEGRQGQVLVEMGAIEPLELVEALAHQMRLKLFELFAWRRGTFRFASERHPPEELIDLELGLAEVAFEGIRAAMDSEKVLEVLEPFQDHYVIPQARKLVRFVPLCTEKALRSVIRRADGSRTLREILDGSGNRGRAAQLVHAMECLDAVRFDARPLRARAQPSSSLPSVPSVITVLPSDEEDGASVFDDLADTTDRGSASAPTSVAKRPARLAEAPEPQGEPRVPGPKVPLIRSVPDPEVETPPSDPASDPAIPLSSSRAAPDNDDSGLRAKPEGALDERVERQLKAERRFRRGQRALKKGSWDAAIEAFDEAVSLCPDEGQFTGHLAYARHKRAPEDPELLEECVHDVETVCERTPELAETHLLRARLLEAAGRRAESEMAYRRVLEIEPDHSEAIIELRGRQD